MTISSKAEVEEELGFFEGVARLIENADGEYELFARSSEDERRLVDFCFWQTRKAG